MNNLIKVTAVAAIAAFTTPFIPANADVPSSITETVPGLVNYQGRLLDVSTGEPYTDGIYTLDLRLYDAATDGTYLWGGRYSAYVKNGYFNLMLGDESAVDLAEKGKYLNADLWKAMWPQKDGDTVRYLEVTPRENSSHVTISEPTAITPRQQLLSSPFAFRAQSAQYANESQGDFNVGGALNVSGKITASSSVNQQFGPIATSSSQVKLSGQTEAVNNALPNIYDVGKYLYFYSYYSMYFKPTAGDMIFTTSSGRKMSIEGAGTFSSTANYNSIGSYVGATTLKGSTITATANGAAVVKGSYAEIRSTATDGAYVRANQKIASMSSCGDTAVNGITVKTDSSDVNNIYLTTDEISVSTHGLTFSSLDYLKIGKVKPIVIKPVTLTVAAGSLVAQTTISDANYCYVSGGHYISDGTHTLQDGAYEVIISKTSDTATAVGVTLPVTRTKAVKIMVLLVGYHKSLVDDQR